MSTTTISKNVLLKSLQAKAKNVINSAQPAAPYRVMSNPVQGNDGTWFFNIDAMSEYHYEQAVKACEEQRFSDATRGFTVNVWDNQLHMLPHIFKGGQALIEIVTYVVKDENGEPLLDDNGDVVTALSAKLIKAIEPSAPKSVDHSSAFASFFEEDDLD